MPPANAAAVNTYRPGIHDRRPWGEWLVLDSGPGFVVKRITVVPGGILSLQRHQGRDEHWVVVSGVARVTRDDTVFDLAANGAAFIPAKMVHRVENPGRDPLVFIEVQCGAHLDEGDIERLQDGYGRA